MNNSKKVFVTGANGMLGSGICRELVQQGFPVKALILKDTLREVIGNLDIEIIEGNILDKDLLLREMEGCEYVIHAAALTTIWPRRSEKIVNVNLSGTRNIMESAAMLNVRRMIHIGTANSFDHGPRKKPGDETGMFHGWSYRLDYIDSKYLAQKMLLEEFSRTGFPVIILNPTYMIGPFDSGPTSGKMIIEVLNKKVPAFSTGGKNFVCSTDVASAAVNALTRGRLGECYIIGGENLSYGEFFKKVCIAGNMEFRMFRVPSGLILILGFFASAVSCITSKPPRLSYTMARMSGVSQYYTSGKAAAELNILQTPVEKAIEMCIRWFRSNGYIR